MRHPSLRATLLAAAVAFAPLAIAAPQSASQPASSAKPNMQVQQRSILDELDLTAAQREAIGNSMRQNMTELQPQAQSLMQVRDAFENAQPGSTGYQSAVNNLANAEADFARTRVQHEGAMRSQVYAILTSAQRSKLQSLLAEQQAKLREMQAREAQQQHAAPPASH